MKHYLAIDLGATSGRTIIGTLDKGRVDLEELTRFDNPLIALSGHLTLSTTKSYADCSSLHNVASRFKASASTPGAATSRSSATTARCSATPSPIATRTPTA